MTNFIKLRLYRSEHDDFDVFEVPFEEGYVVLDLLEYIYENLDSSIAYYDHASCQGQSICNRCFMNINGETEFACEVEVSAGDEITVEPVKDDVYRDIVTK